MAPTVRETMALKATLLPRLMSDKRQVITKDTQTALRGISQPGRTCESVSQFSLSLSKPYHADAQSRGRR